MLIDNSIKKDDVSKYVISIDRKDLFFKGFKTEEFSEEGLTCTENLSKAMIFELGGFYNYSEYKKLIKIIENLGHICGINYVENSITLIKK